MSKLRIATWNVNSVRTRARHVGAWLERKQPDLLLLQEIKCEEQAFPDVFQAQGYQAAIVGQKSYNGVAVLSRAPIDVVERALPGRPAGDDQARYIEIGFAGLRIGNLYLPNGNSGGDVGYEYKLAWMRALQNHARRLLDDDADLILAGDFNVCPADQDFAPGTLGTGDALIRPGSRAAFRALEWLGLTDALRALHPAGRHYTFWDYQAGAWPRDQGLRIDHALLSARLAERLVRAEPDRQERAEDQPSDHVPMLIDLA